jgi:membrane protease YdiL (CAAX protease family)
VETEKPLNDPASAAAPLAQLTAPRTNLFRNERGLRAGWRLLIYFCIVVGVGAVFNLVLRHFRRPPSGTPSFADLAIGEVVGFAFVFGAAAIMARIEGRSVGEYGLPEREAFRSKFWLGFLFGLLEVSLLVGLIAAFGGYSFGSLALTGSAIVLWGLAHGALFLFVGFFEEFLFRGYTQFTLANGIGFWPAAILLSVLFGTGHLANPGEGWIGAASVVLVALFFCFTLKRTGNLWYAVGLHASFDWGETYLYSVPNSGAVLEGHLSNAVLHGPKWLTGGTVGPEGSVFCFLTMGLQFLVVALLFPAKKAEAVEGTPALQN